jgi:hypothetical protein
VAPGRPATQRPAVDLAQLPLNAETHIVPSLGYEVHVSEPKTAKGRRSLALDPATVAGLRQHRARQAQERLATSCPAWTPRRPAR